MIDVVSIKFKNRGKCYYFSPNGLNVRTGDKVIVETAKGLEIADCTHGNHAVMDTAVVQPLRAVQRIATKDDLRIAQLNVQREKEAFEICQEKIAKHGLDMKLVDVECNFEGTKTMFFFTSDGRVDFRELVKDLAGTFRMRIELRQIGVRDEARMLGGIGICGRTYCCAQFLDDFQPVSIKMAKNQGFSLNPTKISGACGRLMCCLKYEEEAYEELVQLVPKLDSFVETPAGVGTVVDVNLLKSTVRVRLEEGGDTSLKTFAASEINVLGGKAKRAEYLAAKTEEKPQEKAPLRIRKGSEVTGNQPVTRLPSAHVKEEKTPEVKPARESRENRETRAQAEARQNQEVLEATVHTEKRRHENRQKRTFHKGRRPHRRDSGDNAE